MVSSLLSDYEVRFFYPLHCHVDASLVDFRFRRLTEAIWRAKDAIYEQFSKTVETRVVIEAGLRDRGSSSVCHDHVFNHVWRGYDGVQSYQYSIGMRAPGNPPPDWKELPRALRIFLEHVPYKPVLAGEPSHPSLAEIVNTYVPPKLETVSTE